MRREFFFFDSPARLARGGNSLSSFETLNASLFLPFSCVTTQAYAEQQQQ
jgi:hypothetical protein